MYFRFVPVLARTLALFRAHFGPLLVVSTVAAIPALIAAGLVLAGVISHDQAIDSPLATFFGALASGLTIAALMPAARRAEAGGRLAPGEAVRLGRASMARGLLTSIAVAACITAGWLVFVLPGLVISVVLVFAVAIAVSDDRHGRFAIRRSAALVNRRGGTMLALLVVFGLVHVAPLAGVAFGVAAVTQDPATIVPAMLIASLVSDIVAGALYACMVVTAYGALRRDEVTAPEQLGAVFA